MADLGMSGFLNLPAHVVLGLHVAARLEILATQVDVALVLSFSACTFRALHGM